MKTLFYKSKGWSDCIARNIPCVFIHPRKKFCTVVIDLIHLGNINQDINFDAQEQKQIEDLLDQYSPKGARLYWGRKAAYFDKVFLEKANELAEELWQLGMKAINRSKSSQPTIS